MATALLLIGLLLPAIMQIAIFVVALKKAPGKALMCLLIPFYIYVYARKEPQAVPFLWGWYAGFAILFVGVVLAS